MAVAALPEIEKPGSADYEEITSVWESSVRATHSFLSEEDLQFYKPLVRHQFLAQVHLFCTRNHFGKINAFIGVSDQNLEMLFIAPDARKNGIGRYLLTLALTKLGVTRIDVNEQNTQALGFYRHFGFIIMNRSETDALGKPYPVLHLQLPKTVAPAPNYS